MCACFGVGVEVGVGSGGEEGGRLSRGCNDIQEEGALV